MALARLSGDFAKKVGGEVVALTVDHGLRAGAADEAAKTVAWCRAAGVSCQTLRWVGEKTVLRRAGGRAPGALSVAGRGV